MWGDGVLVKESERGRETERKKLKTTFKVTTKGTFVYKITLQTLKHGSSHTFAHKQKSHTLRQPHPSIIDCLTYQINKPHGERIAIFAAHERGVCMCTYTAEYSL